MLSWSAGASYLPDLSFLGVCTRGKSIDEQSQASLGFDK
jgi:hypothetical protein